MTTKQVTAQKGGNLVMTSRQVQDTLSELARKVPLTGRGSSSMHSASLLAGADYRVDDGTIQSIVVKFFRSKEITNDSISELLRRLQNEHGISPKDALTTLKAASLNLSAAALCIFELKDTLDAVALETESLLAQGEKTARLDSTKYFSLLRIISRIMACTDQQMLDENRNKIEGNMKVLFSIDDSKAKHLFDEIVQVFSDDELRSKITQELSSVLCENGSHPGNNDARSNKLYAWFSHEDEYHYLPYVLIAANLAKKIACDLGLYEGAKPCKL